MNFVEFLRMLNAPFYIPHVFWGTPIVLAVILELWCAIKDRERV